MADSENKTWYVIKQDNGQCEIAQILPGEGSAPGEEEEDKAPRDQWGPYNSEDEAIAHRVGLIRSGKCLPA